MKNGTQFYIKEHNDIWKYQTNVPLIHILEKYQFWADGWFTKKIYSVILWLLKKMKLRSGITKAEPNTFVMKSYRMYPDQITELIKKHKIDIEYIWHEKPQYLVIGNDAFYQLMKEKPEGFSMINQELQMYNDVPYYDEFDDYNNRKGQNFRRDTMFWQFKVLVVPWINGCFLLPNL